MSEINSIAVLLLVLLMTLFSHSEARTPGCRPLPQCCRRYVFSAGCRGVAAKRNINPALLLSPNEDLSRDPRTPTQNSDPSNNNIDHLIEALPDDDYGHLQSLRDSMDEQPEYNNVFLK